jgi:hypothetical protein
MLNEQGVENEGAARFANSLMHVAVEGISTIGGLAGIAAVLRTFFHRHDGKKIEIKLAEKTTQISISGFSPKDSERLIQEAMRADEDGER